MIELTIDLLKKEAKSFSIIESDHDETSIFGSTDGKAVGTYLEHKFQNYFVYGLSVDYCNQFNS
jgi:hypothetical protein